MRTRAQARAREAATAEPGDQAALFDLPQQHGPAKARRRRMQATTCAECGRPLRSERSVRAGVGTECAAKTGRAVIASRKPADNTPPPAM
ncbi:DUF6011 domain-containing protein [Streptomyces sp. NPDC059063]|uniref:DUF6011 domain-containing protein n=1 Tax=Streptomyces sp. NPDC059063 TaxID=3346712 RepID=UPI00368FF421